MAVSDASGAFLFYAVEEFTGTKEFTWQLPSTALPAGNLKVTVSVGDPENGIHTTKDFEYKIETEMAATEVEVPSGLKLSDVLKVKMVPALSVSGEYVAFTNEKHVANELTDAAGEVLFPQAVAESQKYKMLIKVGGQAVKEVEGEVHVEEGEKKRLYAEFETSVDENLDYATGFSVEFQFVPESGLPCSMSMEKEAFIGVATKIAAEGGSELLKGGRVEYGNEIKCDFKLKDATSGHYLQPGFAYPVISILNKDTRKVLYERRVDFDEDQEYEAQLTIGAAVSNGEAIVAVFIKKGLENVPVMLEDGKPFEAKIEIAGKLTVEPSIVESGKFVIVDLRLTSNGKTVPGTSFDCQIINEKGEKVGSAPVAQLKEGARISWIPPEKSKDSYTFMLYRQGEDKSFFQIPFKIENTIVGMAHKFPVEGMALVCSIVVFFYAIKMRKSIQFNKKNE